MGVLITIDSRDDVWLNNGLTNLCRILKEIEDPRIFECSVFPDRVELNIKNDEDFIRALGRKIIADSDTYIFVRKQNDDGSIDWTKKDYVCIQYGSKVNGRNVLKEKAYTLEGIQELLKAVLVQYGATSGKKLKKDVCILCGQEYLYQKRWDKLKQAVYPFITRNKSMAGVRSNIEAENAPKTRPEYYDNVCPMCYLIGVLEWCDPTHIFLYKGDRSFLFIPELSRLDSLFEFKEKYRHSLDPDRFTSSVRIIIKSGEEEKEGYTQGGSSLMLAFLEKALSQEYKAERISRFKTRVEYFRNWLMLQIPSGNMRDIKPREIGIDQEVIDVIAECIEKSIKIYTSFINNLSVVESASQAPKYDMAEDLKERCSEAFLSNDYDAFAKALAPRGKHMVRFYKDAYDNLNDFVYIWRWKRMKLSEDDLKVVQQVARIIARVAEDHSNLLFKLDKVRNLTDLLDLLREVGRRYTFLEDREYLNAASLAKIAELLVSRDWSIQEFNDFKNTLAVFSYAYTGQNQYFAKANK
ncbi:hypothetical protein SAMN02746089_00065 [Caldanaerobius fijiensis DSM 17918]|uniref:Uncharacterized protein n=1 Tax=Caldanaerobius fijiensis DSM 17918 TaxID=1121256 RepID=A0A1M4SKT0_9THEO|nr:hypothetical protein SAMN02746089_00065 [Caldanaerobius fijiensis DSM 17918]